MTSQDMPARLLRLLSLLQSRPEWPGPELAAKLGVTTRTVRRDIDRLRGLDYAVETSRGVSGGYRLVSGQTLPPLLLDHEEALAVVAGLVTGAGGSIAEDSSLRALEKLTRLLPTRLRTRLATITSATAVVSAQGAARTDPAVIASLAICCGEQERVTFDYCNRAGDTSARRVEPQSLITLEGLWYLLGFDVHRQDWRIFRVDRIDRLAPTGHRFVSRDLPGRPETYVTRSLRNAPYRYTALVTVPLPAETLRAKLFAPLPGEITSDGPHACIVRISAESDEVVAQYVAAVGALTPTFELDASEAIHARMRALGERLSSV
ncbi:helix-turn-helix transcriptional regulator [Streptomyces sp. NPDC059454]|uniref:helix-turn-helix transcriptional regulator n=1 Tax=Streptomyces sp. NPDC059454 TaxID=3346836 RepID=UPI0036C94DF0